MQSTCGRVSWFLNKKNRVIGVSLGCDATTEHEQGSMGVAFSFGYSYDPMDGYAGRKITCLPKAFGVMEVQVDGETCLLLSSHIQSAEFYLRTQLRFPSVSLRGDDSTKDTAAAWDDRGFAILARGRDIAYLRQLAEAFNNLDVMAGGMLASHYKVSGLAYAVVSNVPFHVKAEAEKQIAKDVLEKKEKLVRQSILDKSGVIGRLRDAGHRWFSLGDTTYWADEAKTKIKVWLNPMEQHAHNYGAFTLEELELWVANKGPVMMKPVK